MNSSSLIDSRRNRTYSSLIDSKPGVTQASLKSAKLLRGIALGLLSLLPLQAWSDQKAIVRANTAVQASPFDTSQALGTYRARTTVTLADQPEDGWYRVIFPRAVKGHTEGWVKASSIERFLQNAPVAQQKPQRRQRRHSDSDEWTSGGKNFKDYKFYIGPVFGIHQTSPGVFQDKIGAKQESFFHFSYGAEMGFYFSEAFAGMARFTRYSWSQYTDAYFASGYILMVGGDYAFYRDHGWTIGAGLGLGIGLSEAGNNNGLILKTTSGIFEPLYQVRTSVGKHFGAFSARLELGYRIMNLSAVPVTPPLSVTGTTADLSLSGLFLGLGLFYSF